MKLYADERVDRQVVGALRSAGFEYVAAAYRRESADSEARVRVVMDLAAIAGP